MAIATTHGPVAAVLATPRRDARRYLFGPFSDFLLLGGLSFVLLPIALLLPNSAETKVGVLMVVVALFINLPHFAHSYQTFYRGLRGKLGESSNMHRRYLAAGVIVPGGLAAFLTAAVTMHDVTLLSVAGHAMVFFVGWHYVKQGYGMLVVDGALRNQRFSAFERRILLANAYAVWALTWIAINTGSTGRELFGIESSPLGVPQLFESAAAIVAILTGGSMVVVLARKWAAERALPVSGVTAYLVTLYLWMVFVRIDPIWLLIVPALHSLQYLAVVWRFELNRLQPASATGEGTRSGRGAPGDRRRPFVRFLAVGFVLGLLGFWIVPIAFEITDGAASPAVFLFAF